MPMNACLFYADLSASAPEIRNRRVTGSPDPAITAATATLRIFDYLRFFADVPGEHYYYYEELPAR